MANITLKIDDDLLERARELAFQRKTSINSIVRQRLEEFVSSDFRRDAALKGLQDFFNRTNARIGKKHWSRNELHER